MHIKLFGNSREQLEHQQLTSLVNSMTDAVLAVDENVKVILYNAAALGILDLNTINPGTDLGELFKPIGKDNQPVDITKTVTGTATPTINRDLRLSYGQDNIINLYVSIAPVHLGYGKDGKAGYVIIMRDITREKSLEEEREEFISVVSHELRTPIAVTEGNISNAQLIAEKGGDMAEIQKALSEAHNQTVYLADMINDLATLSRAERGKLELDVTQIDVTQLINSLLASYTPEAAAKGLSLLAHIPQELPALSSSELYVKEILQNFITNAIKYTSEGKVTIGAEAMDTGLEFTIQDTGIGISKSDQEKVFDKFFRSEDFKTREASGTGLGLYITMKLARHLNASISVDSEPGKGSTFTVVIPNLEPVGPGQAPSQQASQAPEPKPETASAPVPAEASKP